MEERLREMLRIAHEILDEGRAPTEVERARFKALETELAEEPADLAERFGDLVDRFAAALEGMGI
jgi:hypothetical protein